MLRFNRITRRVILLAAILCGLLMPASAVGKRVITVIYPNIKQPYAKVFEDINQGFSSSVAADVKTVVLQKSDDLASLKQRVSKEGPNAIVALGSSSLRIAESLELDVPVFGGAVVKNGHDIAGISMVPDADVVADTLIRIQPQVKVVHVVTRKDSFDALLADMEQVLKKRGLRLELHYADSYKSAAFIYRDILQKVTREDAIWLTPGAPFLDNSVLSLILEVVWEQDAVLFSSNPSHIGVGALFAVYPNNVAMGRRLGELVNQSLDSEKQIGLQPVKDLFVGINERTAKHIGITIDDIDFGELEVIRLAQ